MTEKSYVGMEQHVCPVCCKQFDTGSVLIDRRLKASLSRYTVTGMSMCPEHQKMKDAGYIALIECDPAKTKVHGTTHEARAHLKDAYRTGNVAHIRAAAFASMFNISTPEGGICFIEPDVFSILVKMMADAGTQPDDKPVTGTP